MGTAIPAGTTVLGLDGLGGCESFADYSQWESWQAERQRTAQVSVRAAPQVPTEPPSSKPARKKLSYLEAREYDSIEQRIAAAERLLHTKRSQLEDPAIASDSPRIRAAHAEMEAAQMDLDGLYARWAELAEKNG